jgi:NhaP-type Na+/H+ or K+/H+ antiporter
MKPEGWYLFLGALMLAVTFLDRLVQRLPITTTMVYLAVGIAIGPLGFELLTLDPVEHSRFFEFVTELAVTISLFTAGLKLRVTFAEQRWQLPIRLALVSMTLTVGMIAAFGCLVLGLSLGAAILLGAILAPTDPVLASDVQLEHPGDRDRLRFSLTGEAGLNDGTAFPFVMMGLGLLGAHSLGTGASRWLAMDVIWATGGGLAIGWVLGAIVGKQVEHLQRKHEETLGRDEFLCLGLIAFSYGAALALKTYGFLAVFAAGLAFQKIHRQTKPANTGPGRVPTVREGPPAPTATSVLSANEQLERIFEAALVLMLGAMLSPSYLSLEAVGLAAVLFFVVRPLAVFAGCYKASASGIQKALLSWFGIRGIGSLYYLMYAMQHGLPADQAKRLASLILSVVTISILAHGVSVTPLMNLYERRHAKGRPS